MIGALYGRIIGLIMVDLFGIHLDNDYLSWMDPGAFALIGSASFFGGVSRLAPAITVIMVRIKLAEIRYHKIFKTNIQLHLTFLI